jgi:hypothetical protein
MKNLLFLSFLFLFTGKSFSQQDIITLKSGEELKVSISEVTPSEIKFKKTLDGPIFSMNKSEVFMVAYENGRKEVFNQSQESIKNKITKKDKDDDDELLPTKRYGGPRIGLTYLSQGSNRQFVGAPVVSQFGWQFETRIFKLADGSGALFEVIPLIGGLDRGKFLPSISTIFGYRLANGIEFGVGPNLSLSGVGLVYAIGFSFKSGNVTFPINIAFAPSTNNFLYEEYDPNFNPTDDYKYTGSRLSLIIGFNSRKQ